MARSKATFYCKYAIDSVAPRRKTSGMTFLQPIRYTVFLFCFLFIHLTGRSQEKPQPPKTIAALQRAIENVLKETGTPAVGVALVNGDSTVWVTGLGKANLEKNTKVTATTLFRIGSVSKMFVSLAILKLQEEGRIRLKDKVRDLAPEIAYVNPWEKTAPILVGASAGTHHGLGTICTWRITPSTIQPLR